MAKICYFFKGGTTDWHTVKKVNEFVNNASKVFVSVDASHEPAQVYRDMKTYSKFVSVDSYMIIQDTKLDRMQRSVFLTQYTLILISFWKKILDLKWIET